MSDEEFFEYCFIAIGTQVLMSDSSYKNIEDIKLGDIVKSWNEDTNELNDSKVINLHQPIHDDMIIVDWGDGFNKNTFDRPYYVKGKGWSSYKSFQINNEKI